MEVLGSIWSRPLAVLVIGLFAVSCSNEPFGPDITDSPAVPPKVLSVTPDNRSVGPFNQTYIEIRFNKTMNESSLRKAVSLLEPTTGAEIDTDGCWFLDSARREWAVNGVRELEWQIPKYRIGQQYRLVIGNAATDLYGNHLAPYWYEFTPEPYFRFTELQPGATGTGRSTWWCWFNSPVDSSFWNYVQIDPPMDAEWLKGVAPWVWVLEGRNLTPGQPYTLTIRDGAHDRFGNPLQGQKVFSLGTPSNP